MNALPGLGERSTSNTNGKPSGSLPDVTNNNNMNHTPTPENNKTVEEFLKGIFANSSSTQMEPQQQQPLMEIPRPVSSELPSHSGHENGITVKQPPINTNLPLPQHLLFGTAAESLDFSISTGALQKLAEPVLRRLASKGDQNSVVVMMKNYKQVESMQRLKNFLDSGKYQPFRPLTILEYIDEETGATKAWEYKKDGSLRAVKVTQTTQDLFEKEIDLYFFSVEIGFEELRVESMANIQKYPKSSKGIWLLVEKLPLFKGTPLRTYILELLDANARELTKLPEYLPFLKKMVKFEEEDRELGERLLDNYISASDFARRSNSFPIPKTVDPIPAKEVSIQRRESSDFISGRRSSTAIEEPPSPKLERKKTLSNLNLGLNPDELSGLATAIYSGRLVVTLEEGYGTLTQKGSGRNRDFTFQAGELMLLSYEPAANGHNNCIVYNGKRERGDIRRAYVREIPVHLGVEKLRSIYVPSSSLEDRISDRASDRGAYSRDREQRANPSRERSRSPHGVLRYSRRT